MRALALILVILASSLCQARRSKEAPEEQTPARQAISDTDMRRLSYFFIEGTKEKLSGNLSSAYDLFAHCLSIDPDAPEVLFELAILRLFALQDDSTSFAMARRATELDPLNTSYLEFLARIYIELNDYDNTIATFEKLSSIQTTRTDYLYSLERLYAVKGDTEKRIAVLDRIELLEGRDIATTSQKYKIYRSVNKKKQAFAELASLMEEQPHDPEIAVQLGREYIADGQKQKALECFRRAEKIDPNNTLLQIALMEYLRSEGDESVYNARRDSLLFAPDTDEDMRMWLLSELNDEDEQSHDNGQAFMLTVDSIAKLYPSDFVYAMRAGLYERHGASRDSIVSAIEDFVSIDPSNLQVIRALLNYYIEDESYTKAVDLCHIALNSHPDDLGIHYTLGALLIHIGNIDAAIEAYEDAVSKANEEDDPTSVSELYYVLGDCYHDRGDKDKAYEAYTQSLAYNEDNASCLNNYSYYLALEGAELEKAERMAYRAIKIEPLNKTYLDTYAWVLFCNGNASMAKFYIDRVVPPSASDDDILADADTHAEVISHAADIYRANELNEQAERYAHLAKLKELSEAQEASPSQDTDE